MVGESGSGKSTLARLIMAFERPDAGAVLFRGAICIGSGARTAQPAARFSDGFPRPFRLTQPAPPRRLVHRRALRANGETEDIPRRIAEALEQVGLHAADAGKYPHEFSGGQRQRIAIARAIVTRPALLVADEAVSALDVSVQAQILNLLMDLQDDLGLGMVFISHDLAVVGSICDRVLVLQHGKTLESGAAVDVLRSPEHPYTKTLLTAAGVRP